MQKGNYQQAADAHFTCQSFLTAYPKGVSYFSMPHVRMTALSREVYLHPINPRQFTKIKSPHALMCSQTLSNCANSGHDPKQTSLNIHLVQTA